MTTATKTKPDAADAKTAPKGKGKGDGKGKSKKKLIMIVVGLLVVLGGVYQFVLAPAPKPGPPVGGVVVPLDPTTLNLADGHYLKIGLGIQPIKGKEQADDAHYLEAEQIAIDVFTDRTVKELTTSRAKLTAELTQKIKKAYPDQIFKVIVAQFVTQ